MFLENSRYYAVKQVNVKTGNGRTVKAVTLRRLPQETNTVSVTVKENHRLDILSQQRYDDPTKFWHIADANTELQANDLHVEVGEKISVPEK